MRSLKRHIASLAAVSLTALVWSGCTAKQQTEYVTGVSTQVKVPRDLQYIRLSVSVGGVRTFCRAYPVYNGRVQLPRSLGTFAENDPSSEPITYQIVGYTEKLEEGDALDDVACGEKSKVGADGARILRRSRQPYVKEEVLFLPMPLKYSCYDTNCDGSDPNNPDTSKTCKGGKCVDANVSFPEKVFPKFSPELVDGTGGDCFSSSFCMGAGLPAIPVNLDDCTYAVANTPSMPATVQGFPAPFPAVPAGTPNEGVNVEVTYDGGYVREVLDKDPDEGFSIPDPAKPQQFRLAPGLCEMVKGKADATPSKRITAIRASATCRPKVITQPICKDDSLAAMGLDPEGTSTDPTDVAGCSATELKPPRTGLIVAIDDTKEHESFFTGADVQFAINLALQDPAFYRADIGIVYSAGPTACGASSSNVAVPLESAVTVVPKIKASIEGQKTALASKSEGTEIPRLDEGLRLSYEALNANPAYFRRAVILVGERDFLGNACVDPATQSAKARVASAKPAVETFVFDLAGNSNDPTAPADAFELADAAGTPMTDSRGSNKAPAKEGFQRVVERLATCVYDAPQSGQALPEDGTLSYNDPVVPSIVRRIDPAPGCVDGTQDAQNGWGRGTDGRIYICGEACTKYRETLKNAALVTLPFGQPPPAMPVFAHKKNCGPKGT
jgi:hypothetical protein